MYIIMSETFIKIDSLQHFEISSPTYPTNGSKILWKTVSKHLNRVLNLFSQMSYNFVYLDPVPGKQTNSKGMRYFGPKVSLTDECVFTEDFTVCVGSAVLRGLHSVLLMPKKNDCVNGAGSNVDVMLTRSAHLLIVQSFWNVWHFPSNLGK